MTTVAYDHENGLIAFDSRMTSGNLILTDDDMKMVFSGDEAWFLCGPLADTDRFLHQFRSENPDPPKYDIGVDSLCANECGVFRAAVDANTGEPWRSPLVANMAIGTGADFALAAMDHGKTAEDAVKYAMTRDCFTGGKVRVFDIKTMKLVKGKP